jgi:hypothetical protein
MVLGILRLPTPPMHETDLCGQVEGVAGRGGVFHVEVDLRRGSVVHGLARGIFQECHNATTATYQP